MNRPYILTCAAANDLRSIVRYTTEQWGVEQCQYYVAQLEKAATEVALGQGIFKRLDELHLGLRMCKVEHHYLFCLSRPNEPALILAILHERMNLMQRLKGRLI